MLYSHFYTSNDQLKTNGQTIKSLQENAVSTLTTFIVSVIFILFGFTGYSQTQAEFRIDPSTDKVQIWANEVYQDCPEYASAEHVKIYKEQVQKVIITEVADLSNYYDLIDLSTVGLKNKCNFSLQHDTSVDFSPNNFNPLKYFFDFYASGYKSYHISGTNYIITITN